MTLLLNAGLALDVHHLDEAGAEGIGLFRTEFQFMVSETLPRLESQTMLYRDVLDAAGMRPVTFRTLDLGGDKVLPYVAAEREENPALGWRAVRIGLDRPALLRYQLRALISAAAGPAAARHVSAGHHRVGVRRGAGAGGSRAGMVPDERPHAAVAGRGWRHGRGAGAGVRASPT